MLDDLLDDYVENDRGAAELVADGFDQALVERVLRLTDVAEYKRRQYPPGTKISSKGFGRDRRLPVTNRWRETRARAGLADGRKPAQGRVDELGRARAGRRVATARAHLVHVARSSR